MRLTEFLLACIAEDEEDVPYLFDTFERVGDRLIDLHARYLADCKAKRQIVRRHRPVPVGIPEITCHCCRANWPCPDVTDLAAVYADHPDYREVEKP